MMMMMVVVVLGQKRSGDGGLDGLLLDGGAGSGVDDAGGVLAFVVEARAQGPRDGAEGEQTGHLLTRVAQVHPEGPSVQVVHGAPGGRRPRLDDGERVDVHQRRLRWELQRTRVRGVVGHGVAVRKPNVAT